MTKDIILSVKKAADGNVTVSVTEVLKNAQGRQIGSMSSDVTDSVQASDMTTLSAMVDTLKTILEAK
jgi:hypothetical protein